MQSRNWVQRLADGMELESESIPGLPLLELAGDRRVLIERHKGILEYGNGKIGVKVNYGTLVIHGCGLEVTRMSKEQLVISGRIDCVQICRRGI